MLLGTLITFAAQPEQRSRRDEGGGPFGAPDARAADPRQPRRRRRSCSPSTRRSSSSPTATVNAWSDNDYQPAAARKRDPAPTSGCARRRSDPGAGSRRAGRASTLEDLTVYDREGGVAAASIHADRGRSAGGRLEARGRAASTIRPMSMVRRCRRYRARRRAARPVHAGQRRPRSSSISGP